MDDAGDDSAGAHLSIGWSIATTPVLASLLLVVVVAAGEWSARRPAIRAHLMTPSVGARVRELDLQLMRLADYHARGALDGVVIGSSLVSTGIDPRVLDGVYRRHAGRPLRTYAFGIPVLTAAGAAALARIVLEEHRPQLVVYGFAARAFKMQGRDGPVDPTLEVPWVQHRIGVRSFEGWLVEHSAAYRQLLPYRHLLSASAWMQILEHDRKPHVAGFLESDTALTNAPPPAAQPADTPEAAEAEPDLAPLEALARMRADRVALVLLEMPVDPRMLARIPTGTRDAAVVRARVAEFAAAHDIPFLHPDPHLIPAEGWREGLHLNTRGATVFSTWLGERLARDPRLERALRRP